MALSPTKVEPTPRTFPLKREYWCFISYRHADNKEPGRQWATWLHQALETYEIPADLIGTKNERGDVIPDRIFPVFRDEEELPADAALSSQIEAALQRSRFLVVLCSPRAAQSPYVTGEILRFKQLGRQDRILAAIIDGEPNATDAPAKLSLPAECFPSSLRYAIDQNGALTQERAEPIAADFRLPDGSCGWTTPAAYRESLRLAKTPDRLAALKVAEYAQRQNLMFLKILAGVLAVPLGTLTKRDAAFQIAKARRQQRMVTFFALLVALILVLATAWFLQRRTTAAIQEEKNNTDELTAEMTLKKGMDLTDRGYGGSGLLWLARSLSQCPSTPRGLQLQREIRTVMASSSASIHRLESLFDAPNLGVVSMFSPDGRTILMAGGPTATLIDSVSGARMGGLLEIPRESISGGAFSPDGKTVVVSTMKGTIQLAQADTLAKIGPPLKHSATVKSVAFTSDGTRFLVAAQREDSQGAPQTETTGASQEGAHLQLYDVATRRPAAPAFNCADNLYTAVFSPDGRFIATGSKEKNAQIWDAATGLPVGPPLRHPALVFAVAFTPDGQTLASGCLDGRIRFWNLRTHAATGPVLSHKMAIRTLVFNRAGDLLLSGSEDGAVKLWTWPVGALVGQILDHPAQLRQAWFSPDETRLLTTGFEGVARIWRAAPPNALALTLPHAAPVAVAAFSPDGRKVLTGCQESQDESGVSQLWDAATGAPLGPSMPQQGQVMFGTFSSDGRLVLTAGNDNTARLWNAEDSRPLGPPIPYPNTVGGAAFSSDARFVALGGRGFLVQLHDIAKNNQVASWVAGTPPEGKWVWNLIFSPDGRSLITSGDKSANIWSVPSGAPIGQPMTHTSEVRTILLSPDAKIILTCSFDKTARFWSAADGTPLGQPMPHGGEVRAGTFRRDGKIIATASADGAVRLWRVPSGAPFLDKALLHDGWVRSVDFSPDGKTLVTGSDDGLAQLWDVETGAALGAVLRHQGPVNRVAYHQDGRTILTASNDHSARLWTPPPPLLGDPALLLLEAEILTGMELDKDGTAHTLPPAVWRDKRKRQQQQQPQNQGGRP